MSSNPNQNSILTYQCFIPDVRLGYTLTRHLLGSAQFLNCTRWWRRGPAWQYVDRALAVLFATDPDRAGVRLVIRHLNSDRLGQKLPTRSPRPGVLPPAR